MLPEAQIGYLTIFSPPQVIKPGTMNEWEGRRMRNDPEGLERVCSDVLYNEQLQVEHEDAMSLLSCGQ